MKSLLATSIVLAAAALAHAAGGPGPHGGPGGRFPHGGPAMDRSLFPPDLLLSNQIALGLTEEQVATIKKGINETHQRVLDVHTNLQRVTEQLDDALDAPRVDEAAALALAGQAMDLEKQVKTAHMGLLIRVKNLLTPEQQDKARALRPADDRVKARRMDPEGSRPDF